LRTSAAILAVLVLGACGSGSSSSNGTATAGGAVGRTDACALVSTGEVNSLFGVRATQAAGPIAGSSCAWNATSLPGGLACKCVIHVLTVATYGDLGKRWRDIIPRTQAQTQSDITGIGDKATIATMTNASLEIAFVRHGRTVVLIYAISSYQAPTHPKATTQRDAFIALARTASKRA